VCSSTLRFFATHFSSFIAAAHLYEQGNVKVIEVVCTSSCAIWQWSALNLGDEIDHLVKIDCKNQPIVLNLWFIAKTNHIYKRYETKSHEKY
jgi:hypothetical protein